MQGLERIATPSEDSVLQAQLLLKIYQFYLVYLIGRRFGSVEMRVAKWIITTNQKMQKLSRE